MKRVILTLLITAAAATAYVASPFVAAFRIGEAIKAGDSAYLAGKVEWTPVRASLRGSIGPVAMGIPDPGAGATLSYWQRLKLRLSQRSIDRAVDGYVTPEGLPRLFTYGQTYRRLRGRIEPPRTLANLPWRIQQTWSRLKRGVFLSPAMVEIEAQDRYSPDRHYIGRLQLQGLEWRLVSLSVKLVPDVGELVQAGEFERYLAEDGVEIQ
jgi:Protein of unknown function (DUF2939)